MMNEPKSKLRLRIIDALFVGWTLLSYRDFDSWAMAVAVVWISFLTMLNIFMIFAIMGANELLAGPYGHFVQVALHALCGGALYFRYLRDRTASQQLIECYVSTGRSRYAKAVAILYLLTVPIPAVIYVALAHE